MSLHTVTSSDDFKNILENHEYVLMEFFASWCPHCQAFQPDLEVASERLSSQNIYTAQTEIDTFSDLASEYGIESIPTLIFFKDGQPVQETVGERSPQDVLEFVKQAKEE